MKVIAIDPGESVGLVMVTDGHVLGRTLQGEDRNVKLWSIMQSFCPDVVVYESFALRQSAAAKLVGNKFITCEVIGVIKLYCRLKMLEPIVLTPSTKNYCGFSDRPYDPEFKNIALPGDEKITEHTRDAYRLYRYAKLFKMQEGS